MYGLRGENLMWLIGAVVCLLAADRGSKYCLSFKRAMDGCILRCGIISSCQPAATSKIVRALLATSPLHVKKRYSKYCTLL